MTTSPYAVLTAKKQTGSGGGLSAHIDRQRWDDELKKIVPYQPQSVTHPERTALNKEYIMAPDTNRTEAIEQRIKEAGITRKIKDDAVKAICFICTSDHEKMKEIERNGKLDQWANDCIGWLQKEFGTKNVVAASLHMDEKTPHLHVTVVPVVEGQAKERKKRPKLDENGSPIEKPKRTIRKQKVTARLCAKDLMHPKAMERWQTEFAQAMEKYGMARGIDGSSNKHQEPKEYNAKESARERALGIVGMDKRSRKFRQAMSDLKEKHKEETDGLKQSLARAEGENKDLQAQITTEAERYKAEMAKAAQIEKNKLLELKEENARISKELTDKSEKLKKAEEQVKTRDRDIIRMQRAIGNIAEHLPGATEAKEVVNKACTHDHQKWATITAEDIKAFLKALSPIKDDKAKNLIIYHWWCKAYKYTSGFVTKEKYENVLRDLQNIARGTLTRPMEMEIEDERIFQEKKENKMKR